jgi:hypothetical protein
MATQASHLYPGAGLEVRFQLQGYNAGGRYPIGAHANSEGSDSELLIIREVAMMILMDKLTDKVSWHEKVFDNDIVARWRREALEQSEDELYRQITDGKLHSQGYNELDPISRPRARILSEKAFDYVGCFRTEGSINQARH